MCGLTVFLWYSVVFLWSGVLSRLAQQTVVPVSRLPVPIPDDVVDTSDDDDDLVDQSTAPPHIAHQPRPFAVCS